MPPGGDLHWWRPTGVELPTPRVGLRAATIDKVLFVTGGYGNSNDLAEILSWDPLQESWEPVGDLKLGRSYHAAVAIPSSIIESECSAIP